MILTESHQGIVEWVLQRPACNEIGLEMLASLEAAVEALRKTPPRALIVRSGLEGGFCAGADLRALYEGLASSERGDARAQVAQFLDRIHGVMDAIDTFEFPTLGLIHGVCFGGGLELALTLDVLIAQDDARFAFPELRLGLIPGFGGIPRLRRDVGNAVVRDLLLTGRSFNARKAQHIGLVSQVVSKDHALKVVRQMATHMSKHDAHTVATAKRFMKQHPTQELLEEKRLFLDLIERPNVIEALKTFYYSQDVRPYLA